MEIAQRFNAGTTVREGPSPEGTAELLVPQPSLRDSIGFGVQPSVETLGDSQSSLRNEAVGPKTARAERSALPHSAWQFSLDREISGLAAICTIALLAAHPSLAQTVAAPEAAASPVLTNIAALRAAALTTPTNWHALSVEGDIWWANSEQGRFVLEDASGAEELQVDLAGEEVRAGDRVRLEGRGTIARRGAALLLGARGSIVDNDGLHGMAENSGAVYLTAGWQPFRLDWFNGADRFGLELEYEGPGLARRTMIFF